MASQLLEVPLFNQATDFWCWAAVASAVAGYFQRDLPQFSQCDVATHIVNNTVACCANPTPQACLFSARLDDAFKAIGLPNAHMVPPLLFPQVAEQILTLRYPLGIRLTGPGVAGHFVLVVGCDDSNEEVVVADPSGPPGLPSWRGWMKYEKLLNDYAGWQGRCTDAVLLG